MLYRDVPSGEADEANDGPDSQLTTIADATQPCTMDICGAFDLNHTTILFAFGMHKFGVKRPLVVTCVCPELDFVAFKRDQG